jgi:NAD(P)H-hydrate epimerase
MVKVQNVGKTILKNIYRQRPEWSHKGHFGRLLVIGGSKQYSGSPAFSALAAYRAGVDLVTVAAPERAANIIAGFSPDLITVPLEGDYLSGRHVKDILELMKKHTAVAIGGGLERKKETFEAIEKILRDCNLPCVIDADAIHYAEELKKNFLITPHAHEFYLLTDKKVKDDEKDRVKAVAAAAKKVRSTILLKGHVDVISDGKNTAVNRTGNPYMTKGGTGDTLTGIAGALLARGVSLFDSACAAAYINGAAGDLAAKKYGEGLMASDILEMIPKVIS